MIDSVSIIRPSGYSHSEAFREVANSFNAALDLSPEVAIGEYPVTDHSLVFGAHLTTELPKDCVIYQTEQVCRPQDSAWMTAHYFRALKEHEVWDYSLKNIEALARHGIKAKHVPIGYMPCMTNKYADGFKVGCPDSDINAPDPRPIDILHYGSMTPRREAVLNELKRSGLNVFTLFGKYGEERDRLIARSKVVLNLHYYPANIFEIFRCSHLFANKACVVSEYGADKVLESTYYNGAAFAEYDDLVHVCKSLVGNDTARRAIAAAGYKIFSRRTQRDILIDCGIIEKADA